MRKAIIWGASGHAKALYPVLQELGFSIAALIDRDKTIKSFIPDCPVFSSDEDIPFEDGDDIFFAVAIGGERGRDRVQIHERLAKRGFKPLTLVHRTAWVAKTAALDMGVQVLGMAAVSEEARIGLQTIINTSASIDHECVIGKGCHIMPGATLAGCIEAGDFSTVGTNATILPRITIGKWCTIGAGAVVTKNVPDYAVVVGNPAKILKMNPAE